jgi:Integral membrane protein TerC family
MSLMPFLLALTDAAAPAAVSTAALFSVESLVALVTLASLEIVLGIDNVIFIAILAGKLPAAQQPKARRLGIGAAVVTRILLLMSIAWVMRLVHPLFTVAGVAVSGKQLILMLGGLFLIAKATYEIHDKLEGTEHHAAAGKAAATMAAVVAQIMVIDIVFSLDSVITAVAAADHDRGRADGRRRDAHLRGPDQRLRASAPDDEDPGAVVPDHDWRDAGGRGLWSAHQQGVHLLRDGVLAARRVDQPADPEEGGAGRTAPHAAAGTDVVWSPLL